MIQYIWHVFVIFLLTVNIVIKLKIKRIEGQL